MSQSKSEFPEMVAGEDGWCEWRHPLPGFLMECCGCGLVHELQFAISDSSDAGPQNPGEAAGVIVVFRARVHEQSGRGASAIGGRELSERFKNVSP